MQREDAALNLDRNSGGAGKIMFPKPISLKRRGSILWIITNMESFEHLSSN